MIQKVPQLEGVFGRVEKAAERSARTVIDSEAARQKATESLNAGQKKTADEYQKGQKAAEAATVSAASAENAAAQGREEALRREMKQRELMEQFKGMGKRPKPAGGRFRRGKLRNASSNGSGN